MRIFAACLCTVLIEAPFLALFGFRDRYALTVTVCANIVTNLVLNLTLFFLGSWVLETVLLLEAAVVAAEFLIYSLAFAPSVRLFFLTLAANVLSFTLGLFLFR